MRGMRRAVGRKTVDGRSRRGTVRGGRRVVRTPYGIKVGTEVVVRNDNTSTDISIIRPRVRPAYRMCRAVRRNCLVTCSFKNRLIPSAILVLSLPKEEKSRVTCENRVIARDSERYRNRFFSILFH